MHNDSSSYFGAATLLTVAPFATSFLHLLWLAWGHGLAGVVWHAGHGLAFQEAMIDWL